jgi:hypothetical protein
MAHDLRTIEKKVGAWQSSYSDNNQRGYNAIDFTIGNSQWSGGVKASRAAKNKETLTVNNAIKYLNRALNQMRQIEFVMDVTPTDTPETPEQIKEYNAFKMFFRHHYNSPKQQGKYFESIQKMLTFSYSVIEIKYDREDQKTLNKMPYKKVHADPSSCFFDLNAKHPTKYDGEYCGYRTEVDKESIEMYYPEFAKKNELKDSNLWTVYYYRKWIKSNYVQLKTGVYKRYDLLDSEEEKLIQRDKLGLPIVKAEWVSEIWMKQYCNKYIVGKPALYPTDDLPMIYNFALTQWTKDGYQTYPYTYYMQDAQKMHNFVVSQIATMVKNATAAKYFFTQKHLQNETQKNDAKNINSLEGGFTWGEDALQPLPQKIQPDEVPQSLMALAQQSNQELESISGAAFEMQPSDNVVVSGRAIREYTHNIQMMNSGIVASIIEFIDISCMLEMQMITKIVTEERVLCVKDDNGKMVNVVINKRLETGVIVNDIKDIADRFYYEIKASATTQMQKDNTQRAIEMMTKASPGSFALLGDIFAKCIDSPYSGEMVRRLQIGMDPDLLAVSDGEISEEEYRQKRQQKQQAQQQAQGQKEQMMMQEQRKAEHALAEAEHKKGDAAIERAKNEKLKIAVDAEDKKAKNTIEMVKVQGELGQSQQQIDLERMKAAVEEMRNVLSAISLERAPESLGSMPNASD